LKAGEPYLSFQIGFLSLIFMSALKVVKKDGCTGEAGPVTNMLASPSIKIALLEASDWPQ
jgi:hypothetical protein